MSEMKKLDMKMFNGVNSFVGIERDNLIVEGETDVFVPFVVKQLWFRSVYKDGCIKTNLVTPLDDISKHKVCVFSAEIYVSGDLLAVGHGSSTTDEENFVETAERRAVSKALGNAGFAWHNGDFRKDMDVAKTQLYIYNNYINAYPFDTTDIQVVQLYEDALVTILPEGYGEDSGKSIAAMDRSRMESIAKNYAIINTGELLVNAKIKFVYLYQSLQVEKDKKPEDTSGEILSDMETNAEDSKPNKRGIRSGRRTKGKKQEKNPDQPDNPMTTEEVQPVEETQPVEEVQPAEETQPAEKGQDEFPVENMEDVFNLPAQDFDIEKMEGNLDNDPFNEDFLEGFLPEENSLEGLGFIDVPTEDCPFVSDPDISPEVLSSLKKMGYNSKDEVTSDWKAHFMRVREYSHKVDWRNFEDVKRFIEEVPVYNNILSHENAEREHIILLGDVLRKQKDEVIRLLDEKRFPVASLRSLVEWYNNYIWNEF